MTTDDLYNDLWVIKWVTPMTHEMTHWTWVMSHIIKSKVKCSITKEKNIGKQENISQWRKMITNVSFKEKKAGKTWKCNTFHHEKPPLPCWFRLEQPGVSSNYITFLLQNVKVDSGCTRSFPAENWLSRVINGHCWCMRIKSLILRTCGWSFQKSTPSLGSSLKSFTFTISAAHLFNI